MSTPMSQDRFYFYSFIGMALLCLGGFVPSFFLRPQFFETPLPVWMHIHGALFTLWYFVAILQAWLILKNKHVLHRELGAVSIDCYQWVYPHLRGSGLPNRYRPARHRWRWFQYHSDLCIYLLRRCRRLFSSATRDP